MTERVIIVIIIFIVIVMRLDQCAVPGSWTFGSGFYSVVSLPLCPDFERFKTPSIINNSAGIPLDDTSVKVVFWYDKRVGLFQLSHGPHNMSVETLIRLWGETLHSIWNV